MHKIILKNILQRILDPGHKYKFNKYKQTLQTYIVKLRNTRTQTQIKYLHLIQSMIINTKIIVNKYVCMYVIL